MRGWEGELREGGEAGNGCLKESIRDQESYDKDGKWRKWKGRIRNFAGDVILRRGEGKKARL